MPLIQSYGHAVEVLIHVEGMRRNVHWLSALAALAKEEWCKQAHETLQPFLVDLVAAHILAPGSMTLIQQCFASDSVC